MTNALRFGWGIFILMLLQSTVGFAQPPGFSDRVYASGFSRLIGLTFDDLGRMYAWERDGRVYVLEDGIRAANPILDLRQEVGNWRDFGLLGVELDPDFLSNGHIYLLYTVDYNHLYLGDPQQDQYFAAFGRITRYTVSNPSAVIDVMQVDPASRLVLVGETPQTGFPCTHESHHVGYLQFGADGTLLATCGDAASYREVDDGGPMDQGDGWIPEVLAGGIMTATEDIGAYRSQVLFSLNGKLIRIDPNTGNGIPSNPHYDVANPRSPASRTWARGLRNPCRMTHKPGTGSTNPADGDPGIFFIGDVGWGGREEFSICDGPDMNFGWPWYEGFSVQGGYDDTTYRPGTNGLPPHDPPVYDWRNGKTARVRYNGTIYQLGAGGIPVSGSSFNGNCSMGGVWYTGTDYPPAYRNSYYQADYGTGWIRQFVFDNNLQPTAVVPFINNGGAVTCVASSPTTGSIYYVNRSNVIRHIVYVGLNQPPTAIAAADQTSGADNVLVSFRGNRSFDPEGDALTYLWDFGDGTTSTDVNPIHTFTSGSNDDVKFRVSLTVDDGNGFPSVDSLIISLNNTPPVILSTSIESKDYYSGTENINLTALATDAEDAAADLRYEWQVYLYHDNHNHAEPIKIAQTTNTVLTPVGCDGVLYFYRVILKVTDTGGLSTEAQKDIYPSCSGPGSDPVAKFDFARVSDIPINYEFDGSPSYDLDGPLASYLWDFGDGQSSTEVKPNHVFFEEGTYTVTLTVTDLTGNPVSTSSMISVVCGASPSGSPTNTIEYERWNGVSGTSLSAINFSQDIPNQLETLTTTEVPTNVAENYGGRIKGYLYPPTSGNYNMWIASDDNGELYVSTDDDPANIALVASVGSWTSSRQWDKFPSQQGTVNFVGGQRYYFEARFKEGGGGDNLALRWELPDNTIEEPIPASRLGLYRGAPYPTLWREDFFLQDGTTADAGATSWTVNTSNMGSNGSFSVNGQALRGNHLSGETIWNSEVIDISGQTGVNVSFDYYGAGVLDPVDYLRVYYKLDGGSEILLLETNQNAPTDWTGFTSSQLTGSNLQLVVRMYNTASDESYFVDKLAVVSAGAIGSGGPSACASCSDTPAPRTALRGQYGSCISEFNNDWLEIQDEFEEALIDINDNNQDLGLVSVETFDHGDVPFVYDQYYFLNRSFKIETEKVPATAVGLKLYILPSEYAAMQALNPTVLSLNDLVLEKYSNGKLGEVGVGSPSILTPTQVSFGTGPDGAHELTFQVNSFSTFFLRAANTTFPVEWLGFEARPLGMDALLTWEVAQDHKGSHFEIERSINQRDFQQIAKVLMEEPAGVSNSYTYVDENIADLGASTIYYRIRQWDFDGGQTLGPLRTVRIDLGEYVQVDIFPNPTRDAFNLKYFLPGETSASYEVFNTLGEIVAQGVLEQGQGEQRVVIPTTHWGAGMYIVRVKHPLGTIKEKVFVE